VLVVSRKVNQSIMIGNEVRVMVAGVDGDQVRLGIEAPRSVPVYRFEIYEELHREKPSDDSQRSPSSVGDASGSHDNPR
jgi:carbon storage regulator